jgi:membrane protease YdiL (CAAX protease family)
MNHLESSFTGKNTFWRYLLMLVLIFAATNTIGAIPLLISMAVSAINDPTVASRLAANPNDLSVLGLGSNTVLIFMLFPFIIGLVTFIILIRPLNGRNLKTVINGTKSFRWNRFFISGLVWIIISAIYLFVNLKVDPSNFTLNNVAGTIIPLILISVLLIPFQAAFEEILFRGYLMQGFTVLFKNRLLPLIMTSVMFGLIHSLNPEVKDFGFFTMMPQYVLFGIIFGVISILDDGIEAAMAAHAANNAFLCIMVHNESSVLQTSALYEQHNVYPWIDFGTMILMGVLVILILKIIFKWKNFSVLIGEVVPLKQEVQIP